MAEYIERETLENELYRRLKFLIAEYGEHDQYTSGFDDAMDKVENFPAADVAPVVHGEWLLRHIGHGHYWECSVCHTNPCIYVTKDTNYCPNCGAKMDGEEQGDA